MANVLINVPKKARKGDLVEIKALILHPMETGFRPGTNGRIIPRNIIERFTATWNGEEIFDMKFSPAIAANPFVSFFATATNATPEPMVSPSALFADTSPAGMWRPLVRGFFASMSRSMKPEGL